VEAAPRHLELRAAAASDSPAVTAFVFSVLREYGLAPVRGRGLGRRLLDHALVRARALGFRRAVLETNTVLVEAIALYRSQGFAPYRAERVSARCNETYALDLDLE
jgi:putative acetyltransferase